MNEDRFDTPCIELEYWPGNCRGLTVKEYEDAQRRVRSLSTPKARAFHEVLWAYDSPPVEQLTAQWHRPGSRRFRVSDPEAYDLQMRRLVGLA